MPRSKRTAAPAKPTKGWSVKLVHPGWRVEECPNCEFPEADGGYCENCGWTRHTHDCLCK